MRNALGFFLLIGLLLGCLFVQNEMERIHHPIAGLLTVAGECCAEGDWESAERLSRSAASRWKQSRAFSAAFADHNPMEEIDSLFACLRVYAQNREKTEFSATCGELSGRIEAMASAHAFTWWNLL